MCAYAVVNFGVSWYSCALRHSHLGGCVACGIQISMHFYMCGFTVNRAVLISLVRGGLLGDPGMLEGCLITAYSFMEEGQSGETSHPLQSGAGSSSICIYIPTG